MAFSTHDAVSTSPTNTFATLNPLDGQYQSYYDISEGNLKLTNSSTANTIDYANYLVSSIFFNMDNSFYFEFIMPDLGDSSGNYVGLFQRETIDYSLQYGRPHATSGTHNAVYMWSNSGQVVRINSSGSTTYSASLSISTTTIIGIFYKSTDQTVSFYNNGTLEESVDISSFNTTYPLRPMFHSYYGEIRVNFGQDHLFAGATLPSGAGSNTPDNGIGTFAFSVPSGAKALCTANIQSSLAIDPNADDLPEDHFKCLIWTGDNAGQRDIPHNMPTAPDLVWIKNRSDGGYGHTIFDSVRGYGANEIQSSGTSAQGAYSGSYGYVDSVDNTNIKLTDGNAAGYSDRKYTNYSGNDYIAWCWKAGGAPSGATSATGSAKRINSSGTQDDTSCSALATAASATITPTLMSINQKSGFSIVKWVGNNTNNSSIPHGLTQTPDFVVLKNTTDAINWGVKLNPSTISAVSNEQQYLYFNLTNPFGTNTGEETQLTSSIIKFVGTNLNFSNGSGDNMIAYCWHAVPGFSAFGSYTGNGSADGPFIYTGHKPSFFLVKCTDSSSVTDHWVILDNARDPHNVVRRKLYPNDAYSENDEVIYWGCDFLSNGVKIRNDYGGSNQTGKNYIYASFAEMPFKYAATNAR